MLIEGRVWKVGHDLVCGGDVLPTGRDPIVTGRYVEAAKYLFESVDPQIGPNLRSGDLILAGRSFGRGHGHYHSSVLRTLMAVKAAGIIAESFTELFLRKAVNLGFPAIECSEIGDLVSTGDVIELDIGNGRFTNKTTGVTATATPPPAIIRQILEAGGIEGYARARLAQAEGGARA